MGKVGDVANLAWKSETTLFILQLTNRIFFPKIIEMLRKQAKLDQQNEN